MVLCRYARAFAARWPRNKGALPRGAPAMGCGGMGGPLVKKQMAHTHMRMCSMVHSHHVSSTPRRSESWGTCS